MSIDLEVILNEISNYDYYKEFKFLPNRRFRFDYMFPLQSKIVKGVAVEFEGGAWSGVGILDPKAL